MCLCSQIIPSSQNCRKHLRNVVKDWQPFVCITLTLCTCLQVWHSQRWQRSPLEVATSKKELCELLFDIPANKNIKLCEECSRYSWIILNLPPYLTFSLSLSHSVQHSKVGKPSSFFDNHPDVCQPAGNILAKKYQTCSCCLLVTSSCNSKQMERDTWARIKNIQPPSVPIYSSQLCLHHATL